MKRNILPVNVTDTRRIKKIKKRKGRGMMHDYFSCPIPWIPFSAAYRKYKAIPTLSKELRVTKHVINIWMIY